MAEKKINSFVLSYLKNGSSNIPVTQRDVDDFFRGHVLQNPKLPIHYQNRISNLVRKYRRDGDISVLVDYLSQKFNCGVFLLEKDRVMLRGLRRMAYHPDFNLLIDLLENEKHLREYFDENFSMYPIYLDTNIRVGNKDVYDIAVVAAEFEGSMLGFVAGLDMDFELAVGILDFLRGHS